MSLITGSPITFTGREAREAILEPAFSKPLITSIMSVTEGIKAKEKIAYFERLTKVTKVDTGCGSTPNDNVINMSEDEWNPVALEMWVSQCASDLEGTFMVWGLATGYERHDLEKATLGEDPQGFWTEFVLSLMEDAAYEDFLRIAYFGDTDLVAADLTNGAADLPNYNQVDGFFKQIFALPDARKYTIAENAGASYAAQELPEGAAVEIMRALITKADPRLKSQGNLVFQVSQSIYDNWAEYRETRNLDTSFAIQETGIDGTKYRNVDVVPMEFWDRTIAADFDNGTTLDLPHRAILTTKENMKAGFDAQDGMQSFESWYEKKDKENHMRGNYKVDFKVMRPYLIAAAY